MIPILIKRIMTIGLVYDGFYDKKTGVETFGDNSLISHYNDVVFLTILHVVM